MHCLVRKKLGWLNKTEHLVILGGEETPTSNGDKPVVAVPPRSGSRKGSSSESGIERGTTEEIDLTNDDMQSLVSVGSEAATTDAGLRDRCRVVKERESAVERKEERLKRREMALREKENKLERAQRDLTRLTEVREREARSWRDERRRREETERRSREASAARAREKRERRKEHTEKRNHEEEKSTKRPPAGELVANYAACPRDRVATSEATTSDHSDLDPLGLSTLGMRSIGSSRTRKQDTILQASERGRQVSNYHYQD